jgi:hypothetical protein
MTIIRLMLSIRLLFNNETSVRSNEIFSSSICIHESTRTLKTCMLKFNVVFDICLARLISQHEKIILIDFNRDLFFQISYCGLHSIDIRRGIFIFFR